MRVATLLFCGVVFVVGCGNGDDALAPEVSDTFRGTWTFTLVPLDPASGFPAPVVCPGSVIATANVPETIVLDAGCRGGAQLSAGLDPPFRSTQAIVGADYDKVVATFAILTGGCTYVSNQIGFSFTITGDALTASAAGNSAHQVQCGVSPDFNLEMDFIGGR